VPQLIYAEDGVNNLLKTLEISF